MMPKKWTTEDVIKRSEAVRKGAAEWLERMRRMLFMVTVQELFNVMPLWRVAHLLDFESAQVVCEFLHDEAV